jgi:hypothetical protein
MTPKEIAEFHRAQLAQMLKDAEELESGKRTNRIERDGQWIDVSKEDAADMRRRADSLGQIIAAYERLDA